MPPARLESQLATLDPTPDVLRVSIDQTPEQISGLVAGFSPEMQFVPMLAANTGNCAAASLGESASAAAWPMSITAWA